MISARIEREITRYLESFGCTARESQIYLQSYQMGPASVQELARKLDCNRVTVHSAIENLIRKGLCFETKKGKRRLIVAEGPTSFENVIEDKRREIGVLESGLQRLNDLLSQVKQPDGHTPTVEFYEDAMGFRRMLERTLSSKTDFYAVINAEMFAEHVGRDYLIDYFIRRAKKGIHSRLVFPPVEWARVVGRRAKEFKIQVRIIPTEVAWRSGIFSWDNTLSIKSLTNNRLTCTIIENPDIAWFFRNILFEIVWDLQNHFGFESVTTDREKREE